MAAFAAPLALAMRPVRVTRVATCTMQTASNGAHSTTRRAVLSLAALVIPHVLLPSSARAESSYERKVKGRVAVIRLGRDKAAALSAIVKKMPATMLENDEFYVLRFVPIWLETARVACTDIAAQEEVDLGESPVLTGAAAELTGHLLELRAEARGGRRDGVLRELDEIIETVDKLLALPKVAPYAVEKK